MECRGHTVYDRGMLPDRINFTGLELDPKEFFTPRKITQGVFPEHWVRHQFDLSHDLYFSMSRLDRWIEMNLNGRWGAYSVFTMRALIVVILFEEVTDAVIFRLQGGERAWAENP